MNVEEKFDIVKRKIRIMQFGEGNFLRCFVDWMISLMNEDDTVKFSSNVVVVQPLSYGMIEGLKKQNGLYTVTLEGIKDKEAVRETRLVNCLGDFINPYIEYDKYLSYARSEDLEFIISNTTEAGIALDKNDTNFSKTPNSYPGKLLALLKERYDYFKGDMDKGLDIITCELIDNNGDELKKVLLELSKINQLSNEFINWLTEANHFYNTLVDRIVPGYPKTQIDEYSKLLGYTDNFMVKGEIFNLWVIEDHYHLKDRFDASKIANVKYVEDVKPYKERKVKILNGGHTLLVPVSYLAGYNTVKESINNTHIRAYVKDFMMEEVIPTIKLPHDDMMAFAESTIERYSNPYLRHELMSISLNSITKINTRLMGTVVDNLNEGQLPKRALYAIASWMAFYRAKRGEESINLSDDPKYLSFFKELWDEYDKGIINEEEIVKRVFKLDHWIYDLSKNKEALDFTIKSLKHILKEGTINNFFISYCL